MSRIVQIHNVETGELIFREMTAEELADYEAKEDKRIAEENAKAAKVAEAQAKLAALGLTTEDLKALGLG